MKCWAALAKQPFPFLPFLNIPIFFYLSTFCTNNFQNCQKCATEVYKDPRGEILIEKFIQNIKIVKISPLKYIKNTKFKLQKNRRLFYLNLNLINSNLVNLPAKRAGK